MEGLGIHITGWEDGEKVERDLATTDRWTIHAANEVRLTIAGETIRIKQEPHALNATRIGVGACVWEGEMLLAAYLGSLPRHRYIGSRCIELGSGPGLAGMLLARMGANVLLTDKACVKKLMEDNVKLNELSRDQKKGSASGWVEVDELEWGAEGYEQLAASLAQDPFEWVVAADCVYIDNEGQSPSTPHFMKTLSILCGPNTKCLISFELRSQQVKEVFLAEAAKVFSKVTRIPASALPKGCQVEHIELYQLSR